MALSSAESIESPSATGFWALTLGSIGVVFGDIGTSPLYAFREAVHVAAEGAPVTRVIVLGVLSLILWSLLIVVTAKYVLLLLRADNNGEGGTLSLMALGQRALGRRSVTVAGAGRDRRLDVHRRFDDHAGDLGAVGGRGPEDRGTGAGALCGAADRRHPDRAVRLPELGNGESGVGLRPGDGAVVLHAGAAWPVAYQR